MIFRHLTRKIGKSRELVKKSAVGVEVGGLGEEDYVGYFALLRVRA
jgi:hypothetical protein